ncbi:MAG: Saccharopine dehydrogenase-domain-containing protein [Monoraphidium minutum]|nr:MAG: Saccharopine dehydrogenase-domain-containing protein [Monoraphidium minutum]
MAARELDIVVFGATGFTGARVAEELLAKAAAASPPLRVGLAGRGEAKLRALAQRMPGGGGAAILAGVDVSDPESVARMAAATRVLVNCVGPYRFYGEPVFKAAAEAGTDYLDLCGEPEFIERMELDYGPSAAASGALMACAAAFDSVPNDLGTVLAGRAFAAPAVPCSVESVIRVRAPKGLPIHFATWESAVHGIGSADELRALRARAKAAGRAAPPKPPGPRPGGPAGPSWDPSLEAYTLPFPGADASVVRRTQAALAAAGERPVHFAARFAAPGAYYAAVAVGVGGALMGLAKVAWGRALLLRYPGLFSYGLVSHEGPTQEQMESAQCEVILSAKGYNAPPADPKAAPDMRLTLTIGMGDPGYLFTAKMISSAAITLLQERAAALASVGGAGGVFTAGFLFRDTGLVERLKRDGMRFEVTRE